jgi:hypothetical protein
MLDRNKSRRELFRLYPRDGADMCSSCSWFSFEFDFAAETILPRSPSHSSRRTLQEFHRTTPSLRDKFPREQGGGCAHDERRIGIRNFYMCPDRIDFRIRPQRLPSVVPSSSPLPASHFPTISSRGTRAKNKSIARERRMRGGLRGFSTPGSPITTMCQAKIQRRGEGEGSGGGRGSAEFGSTSWKTSKRRPEILRFRSHSSTSCSTQWVAGKGEDRAGAQ